MTSILDINSDCSDSEDDCDYVPPEGALSETSGEEEANHSVDEEGINSKNTKVKNKKKRRKKCKEIKEEVNSENNEEKPKLSKEEEKKRVENLWNSFLQDVKPVVRKTQVKTTNSAQEPTSKSENLIAKVSNAPSKVKVTEVYEFAGETVTVTKEVDQNSEEAAKKEVTVVDKPEENHAKSEVPKQVNAPSVKRPGGLASVIGKITNKKQKLTTLQKSLYDWNNFKKEEGIEEDLTNYNKGRDGYLEKQAFLQRSDVRQFEVEKSLRLKSKR